MFNPDSRFVQAGRMPMLPEGKCVRWWLGGGRQPDLGGPQAGVMKFPVGSPLALTSVTLSVELLLMLIFSSAFSSAPEVLKFCSKEKRGGGNRTPKIHGVTIFRKKNEILEESPTQLCRLERLVFHSSSRGAVVLRRVLLVEDTGYSQQLELLVQLLG